MISAGVGLLPPAERARVECLAAWYVACAGAGARAGELTTRMLAGHETGEAAFDGFAPVAEAAGLSAVQTGDVLAGLAPCAAPQTDRELLRRAYFAAGSVAVVAARVLGVEAEDVDTLDRASDLGMALYLRAHGEAALAAPYEASGRAGASRLRFRQRWAVLSLLLGPGRGLLAALMSPPERLRAVPAKRGELAV